MTGKPQRILFISYEATLSGSTFVLFEFMKWVKRHQQTEMALILKEDGPHREQFAEISQVHLFNLQPKQFDNRLLSFAYRRMIWPRMKAAYRRRLLEQLRKANFDLIYANTIGVGEILEFLEPLGVKVVSHIHELQYVIDCTGQENIRRALKATSFYIAVSDDVKHGLVKNLGVDTNKIMVFPPFVDFTKVDEGKEETEIKTIRQHLNIPGESFIAGAAGSVEWRKGVDIFIQVAIQVLAEIPTAHFIWVGNPRETSILTRLNYDIKKSGLEGHIQFTGSFKNPYPYFQAFDLFLLTSREDPYPLVCIESMYLNKPVICFEQSGGAVSLVSDYQFGKSVPFLNIRIMANEIIKFIRSKSESFPAIDRLRLKKEHSVETIAPKIFEALSTLF